MATSAQPEAARGSWGLVDAVEVKDFIALGRPVVGWPLLERQLPLTAFSMLVREGAKDGLTRGVCRISGPLENDELICTGPEKMPFRPGMIDCVLLLLRSAGFQSSRQWAFVRDILSVLHEEGLGLVVLPGDLSTPALVAMQEALAQASLVITTLRAMSPSTVDHCCSARVLDAVAQISGDPSSTSPHFVLLQIQRRQERTALDCRAYISNVIALSFKYTQPPEPPYGQAPADLEFFRPMIPESCFLHLPNYHDWRQIYPELSILLEPENFNAIRSEALAIEGWTPWPEYHFREGGESDWRVIPFLHTFPALDASKSRWIEATCRRCPKTIDVLRRLPRLRTALLSKLGPHTKLSAHTGWEDLANFVLRVHLTLKTPGAARVCGMWVEGEVRHHVEQELIVFDDSKVHKAFNLHPSEARVVLILDLLRPEGQPKGVAVGGHTPELDSFIDLFRFLRNMFRNQYDTDVTVWSPQGRLHQVEYAMEAVKQGAACLGLRSDDYVVLAALKRSTHELSSYQKKILRIDDHIGVAISGLTADARSLAKYMRTESLNHKYVYGSALQASRLVVDVADKHQRCTQSYVRRPYGVGLLLAAYDQTGPHLYQTDPSGNYYEYIAMAIGSRAQSAKTYLEKYYKTFNNLEPDELIKHALKALAGSIQGDKELDKDNASIAIVGKGQPLRIIEGDDLKKYLDAIEVEGGAAEPMDEASAADTDAMSMS